MDANADSVVTRLAGQPTTVLAPSPRTTRRGFRLNDSERKLLLAVVDIAIINAALIVSWLLGLKEPVTLQNLVDPYKWYVTLTLVWLASAFLFDVYNLTRSANTILTLRNSGLAALVTVLVYTLIPWLTPPLQNRAFILLFAILTTAGIVVWRVTYAELFVQSQFRRRALIVGAGWAGRTLVDALRAVPDDANAFQGTGYDLVGFVDDNPDYVDSRICNVPVLGGREVLLPLAEALAVDEIILAITHRHAINDDLFDALLRCREMGIRISTMSSVYERVTGRVPVQHAGRDLYTTMPMEGTPAERLYGALKRLVDLGCSLAGLGVLAIVAPAIMIGNHFTSPGPLFYRQQRVGRGGRDFEIYKFRSMVPNAEAQTGAVWAASNDNRITPMGRFLRKTRLDELPQFINILRGEMSLIGPRPERPEFVEELAHTIPFYRARHAVRPGLTGWAQVQYRYGSSHDDARIKLEYDLYYVKQVSILLDLRILLSTIQVMVQFKGQ